MRLSDLVIGTIGVVRKDSFCSKETNILNLEIGVDLIEDMFQVEFSFDSNQTFTIDVGWYGESIHEGHFICFIIKNEDWENPIKKDIVESPSQVFATINQYIKLLETRN